MNRVFTLFMIFAVVGLSTAGWLKTYGTERQDYLEDGVHLDDGGYLLVGYTQTTAGDFDVWCLWLDENGDEVDSRTYGGPYNDKAHGIAKTDDGFIIVGETNSYGRGTPGYSNFFIIKIDGDGNLIQQIPSDGDTLTGGEYDDCLYRIGRYTEGNVFVAVGQYWVDFTDQQQEPFLFAINGATMLGGYNVISTGYGSDEFNDVDFSGDTIFACGDTKNYGSGIPSFSNGYLAGVNADLYADYFNLGFGGENNDKFYGIKYCDGKIYLVGETASFGVDMTDVYAVRYSPELGTEWEQTFGGIYTDVAKDVAIVDGAMFILGKTNSTGAGYDDFYLIKADTTDGTEILERTYGGTGNDWASSILAVGDNLLLIGSSSSPEFDAEDWDGMVVEVGLDGDTVSGIAEYLPESPYILSAFPNPFNSSVEIIVSDGRGLACQTLSNIKVYDLRGNVVYCRRGLPTSITSNTSNDNSLKNRHLEMSPTSRTFVWTPEKNISSGIYFVRAKFDDGTTLTKRIIYSK